MLETSKVILIVTDIQGNLAQLMHDREALFKNVGIMIEGVKALDIPILWIEQYPRGLGPTVPEVASHLDGYEPLPKKTFSSFKNEAINSRFESFNRNQVLLTGIETHVCVYQSAMDLIARGFETYVVCDAVSSRTPLNKQIGLDNIARAGGHITSVEMALFGLLKVAEGEAFKKIIKLVK